MNQEEYMKMPTDELFNILKPRILNEPLGYLPLFKEVYEQGMEKKLVEKDLISDYGTKEWGNKLLEAKLFYIDENIIKLFLSTANKGFKRNLPFNDIFINAYIQINPFTIVGVRVRELLYKQHTVIECLIINKDEICKIVPIPLYLNVNDANVKESTKCLYKKLQLWVFNFLDFLNDPEVKIVTVERDEKRNKKRILHGKIPIPTRCFVKITGQLKIYLDKLNSGAIRKIDHKFWVRGHFRTLRSEFWKNKRGIRIWIPPFIKGEGILIKRNYVVKKDGDMNDNKTTSTT